MVEELALDFGDKLVLLLGEVAHAQHGGLAPFKEDLVALQGHPLGIQG